MSDTLERLRERIDLQDCCDHETVLIPFPQARALLDIAEAAQELVEANRHPRTGYPALSHARLSGALAALDSAGRAER